MTAGREKGQVATIADMAGLAGGRWGGVLAGAGGGYWMEMKTSAINWILTLAKLAGLRSDEALPLLALV